MAISDRIAVMSEGVIRHCGRPKDIYQRPADLFVATFIGKSNLLAADLVSEKAIRFKNGYTVEIPDLAPADAAQREVTVSARPEELLVHTDLEGGGIHAEIMDSVFLGLNTHYFVKMETGEEAEIIQESRIDSILPPGTKVRLTLNAVKANVFDKETSLSLMRGVRNEVEV
jgi:iron(III) transport system ATP-binding protein